MPRVGFIGCGLIARHHATALQTVPGVQIGPVHDTDAQRAAALAAACDGWPAQSARQVIGESDVVYICTWTATHPEFVEMVCDAGKPIFCEKPLAVDYQAAARMTALVEEAGVVNQVGLVLRRSPAFRWLHSQSRLSQHGRVMNVVFRDDQYLPTQGMYRSTWRADPKLAGSGTLLEHSIHDLDLLDWIMGPIVGVTAATAEVHGLDGIEDSASLLLVAASGSQASLVSVWHDVLSRPSQRRVEVFNERAVLTLEGDWNGPVRWERSAGDQGALEGADLDAALHDGLGSNPDAAFMASVESGRPAYPDFRLALRSHAIAEAAYRSAATGGGMVPVPGRPGPGLISC